MSTDPILSVTVGATPEEVWRALRDPAAIVRWFGWDTPGLDEEIALIFHGVVPEGAELPEGLDTTVVVDDEARTLTTGPHRIAVDADAGGAVVRVTRVIDVGDAGWELFHTEIDHIEEGWLTFFQTLAFALVHHPDEARRTVFASGALPGGDPLATLGLGAVTAAPGERYTATLATGDELAGTVWFRSAHQLGLTVDAWGDGLLVAAAVPGGDAEATTAMAIASTYRRPDAEVDAMAARWARWWDDATVSPPATG